MYESGTTIYDSIREVEDDMLLPFPESGYFLFITADPPGSERVSWYPTFDAAISGVRDEEASQELHKSNGGYFDATPEGSSGALGYGDLHYRRYARLDDEARTEIPC